MTGNGIGTPDRKSGRMTGARGLAAAFGRASCLALLLGATGCTYLAGESDAPQARVIGGEQARESAADDSYPPLSAVPARPTGVTTPEERQRLREALISDRANAQYTQDGPVARPTSGVNVPTPGPLPEPGTPPEATRARAAATEQTDEAPARQPQAIPTPVPIEDGGTTPTPVSSTPAPAPVPAASAPTPTTRQQPPIQREESAARPTPAPAPTPVTRQQPPIQTAESAAQPAPVPGPVPPPQPAVPPGGSPAPTPESAGQVTEDDSLGPSGLPRKPGRIVLVEGPDARQNRDSSGAPTGSGATSSSYTGSGTRSGAVPDASSIPVYRGPPETTAQPAPAPTTAAPATTTPATTTPADQPRLSASEQAELAAAYQQALGNRSSETATDVVPAPVPAPVTGPTPGPAQSTGRTVPTPQSQPPQRKIVTVQDAYQAALNQSAEATLGIRAPGGGNGAAAPAQSGSVPYSQSAQPFVPGFSQPVATIFFSDGRTGLTSADRQALQQVSLLQAQSQGRVHIVGHASRSGSPSANRRLSLERANTVAVALIGMGVPREAILIAGAGEGAQPYGLGAAVPAGPAGERRADIYLEN